LPLRAPDELVLPLRAPDKLVLPFRAPDKLAFESSDHASVKIGFTFEEEPLRSPGIVKVNTNILDDPVVVLQIDIGIEEMISQTDDSWNPHARLEFLKVAIQSVFSSKVSDVRKVVNVEIKETEEELIQIENLKVRVLSRSDISQVHMNERVVTIEEAVTSLKSKLLKLRKNSATPLHLCQEQNGLNMAKSQIILFSFN
jgi:hypothetical protein